MKLEALEPNDLGAANFKRQNSELFEANCFKRTSGALHNRLGRLSSSDLQITMAVLYQAGLPGLFRASAFLLMNIPLGRGAGDEERERERR